MNGLLAADLATFRFLNQTLANPVGDLVMPFLSGNRFFVPALMLLGGWLFWRGGRRGRCFVLVIAFSILAGEVLMTGPLKRAFARPRPFVDHPETRLLVGKGSSYSMPSGNSAIWAGAAAVTALFYRRSPRFMVPLAVGVGVSRSYVGVHYPTDVLAGWAIGAAYGLSFAYVADRLWRALGQAWFPRWWRRVPFLLRPDESLPPAETPAGGREEQAHWFRLGALLIALLFVGRVVYLASGSIELSEDEAYQWLWAKHPALSYYSKPPFIAYAQWIGIHLWGDTEIGVRFLAPCVAALLGVMLLRFLTRMTDSRTAFWTVLAVTATPILAVGSTLLTIDPLTVLFWTAAMLSGWEAVTRDSTRHWLWTGLWMGCGFLSKYISPFQWACWVLFFILWKPARAQLLRPGPYLALLINALCTIPVIVWNAQHGWITLTHLSERGGLDQQWRFSTRFLWDFLVTVPLLLNPFFFVAVAVAAGGFWRTSSPAAVAASPTRPVADVGTGTDRRALMRYLFAMGAPVFVFYLLYTLRARVQPNWIAPSIVPLFCLAAVFWHDRSLAGNPWPRRILGAGLALGLPAVLIMHNTNLVAKIAGAPLPARMEPMRRVRGHREAARIVGEQRGLLLREGRPVFVIANHYGRAGLLSFYLPEARAGVPEHPLVFVPTSRVPRNQFWFWPGYEGRRGENALYVMDPDKPGSQLDQLRTEFRDVTDLGIFEALYRGRVFHRLQIFACRDQR